MSRAKRTADLIFAGVGLVFLAPLFLAVAASIKLEDGGPVFFRQVRVGRHGKLFWIWKFRTMVSGAEQLGAPLTIGRDRRITRVGRVLRSSRIDELPQLLNVLAGEMSLIGPRPEVPKYVNLYGAFERRVLDLIPGMTDPASIQYRHESVLLGQMDDPEAYYVHSLMRDKIRLNLEYAETATVWSDLLMIAKTVDSLLRGARGRDYRSNM